MPRVDIPYFKLGRLLVSLPIEEPSTLSAIRIWYVEENSNVLVCRLLFNTLRKEWEVDFTIDYNPKIVSEITLKPVKEVVKFVNEKFPDGKAPV